MRIIRVSFKKQNEAVYISHLDLQRVLTRAIRRANVPAWYTLGFNPHIYITFALPLSLGHSSLCETFDFKTEAETLDKDSLIKALNEALPRGIEVFDIKESEIDAASIKYCKYVIQLDGDTENLLKAVKAFEAADEALVEKKTKKGIAKVNLKEHISKITCKPTPNGIKAEVLLPAGNTFTLNPDLLLGFLSKNYNIDCSTAKVCRTQVLTDKMRVFS
ncbi:MAG: TIGR03936 family radical SAM-associated protein [Oscillospiraceae bacterium]|nr:TIGR03936 family radical SAM-associated protein [Oscillospiraceae bacterium]